MGTASIPLICFYDGDLINENKNAEYVGGKKKLSRVLRTIGFKEFKEEIQAMLGLQPYDSEFTIKCRVYLDEEFQIATDVDDDKSLSSILDESKYIMAYIIKGQPSVINTHQRETNGLPNVEKETIGGGGGVDPPNEMYPRGNFLQPMEQPLPPSNIDASLHGSSNFEPCVNYDASNQTPLQGNIDLAEGQKFPDADDLAKGQEFPDADAFRHALSDLAIRKIFEYKPVKTTKSRLTMKCKSPECKWRIVAGVKDRNLPAFKVTKYRNRHSCPVRPRGGDHDQATIKWIAAKIQPDIKKNRGMTINEITTTISRKFGINISYNKAVKAKNKAIEEVASSSFEESYQYLPGLIKELEKSGCVTKLGCDNENRFLYFFWAFRQCVHALHAHLCPPFIHIQNKSIQSGVLMAADSFACADDEPIYLAFAIFKEEEEDEVCWETFLMLLKEYILADIHLRLPFAIVTEFGRKTTVSLVSKVFPEVHHVFNLDCLYEDFCDKFEDDYLGALMLDAAKAFNVSDCDRALNEIKEKNEDAYQWLLDAGKSHWSKAYFAVGYLLRFEIKWDLEFLTEDIEHLPIAAAVIHITKKVAKGFLEEQAWAATLDPTESNFDIGLWINAALYNAVGINAEEYHAFDVTESHHFTVNLETRTCDCGKFQGIGIPCDHAAAVINHLDLNIEDYCKPWYKNVAIRAIYAEDFLPLANRSEDWQPPKDNEPRILPPKKKVSRPLKTC